MTSNTVSSNSTPIVIALLFTWVILVLVLVYFYKKLNKDTNGQYEVQRLVFAEGGLRDRLRQGVGVVENRFNVRIWPQPRDEEEDDIRANEEGNEEDVGNDTQNESHAEEAEKRGNNDVKDDSSDDYSSIDLKERANRGQKEDKNTEKTEVEAEENEEKQTKEASGENDKHKEELKNEEKVELLVDFKPFSGSAIWSEENKDEVNDLTAL